MTEYVLTDKMRAWAAAHGWNAELHIDHFNDYLANKCGKPYKDLDAAFRSCVRADWGGLRRQVEMVKRGSAAWQASNEGIIAEGRRKGLEARPGESINQFRARIEAI